jgi:hypothetical protein
VIQVLMLDLGETLVHNDTVLPHVPQALETILGFDTAAGEPLEVCLVSDFHMPAQPGDQAEIDRLFAEYVEILDRFDLTAFFEPVEQHVTLSTHAGVLKPDRKVFETALERLGVDAPLAECLFITESAEHVAACRHLGMQALRFSPTGQAPDADFTDWSEAPLLVARSLDPANDTNVHAALAVRVAAAEQLEDVTIDRTLDDGTLQCHAKAWCPISDPELDELDGVHVQLPVDVQVRLDEKQHVASVRYGEPSEEMRSEAAHFVRTLKANKQVAEPSASGAPGTTHVLQTDAQGRKLLKRKRYSVL